MPWSALLSLCALLVGQEQPAIVERRQIDRTLREYLFLDAELGLRHRNIIYTEGAAPGPGARNELRVYLNGQAQSSLPGALALYVGLGFVGRLATDLEGDPIADPYDDFDIQRNFRIFGAYGEWTHRDENQHELIVVRAGRLSDWDARASLLVYDGVFARARLGDLISVSLFGGRRSIFDGELPDGRTGALAQLVAGIDVTGLFSDFTLGLGYRLEEVHRALLSLGWSLEDLLALELSAELLLGGRDALLTDLTFPTETDGVAGIIRLSGDTTLPFDASIAGWLEVQVGQDPRSYGRGGVGPTPAEVDRSLGRPLSAGIIDRILFGPEPPHFSGELVVEQWIIPEFAIDLGLFGRLPFDANDRRSLRPATFEAWFGPELLLASGIRTALEARFSFEDPGASDRVFTASGDGLRRYSSLRLFAQFPWQISESIGISIRPEAEGFFFTSRGPLARAENEPGFSAAILIALQLAELSVAGRYGVSSLPEFGGDGISTIHQVEVWIGGAY